jgi:hypothetical protein
VQIATLSSVAVTHDIPGGQSLDTGLQVNAHCEAGVDSVLPKMQAASAPADPGDGGQMAPSLQLGEQNEPVKSLAFCIQVAPLGHPTEQSP